MKQKTSKAGYVYLMERVTFRSIKARFTGQREIKIGISINPSRRLREVDDDIVGRVKLLQKVWVDDAKGFEKALHDKFKSSNFKPRSKGKGTGGVTEWFLIDKGEYRQLQSELNLSDGWWWTSLLIGLALILIFFLYLFFTAYFQAKPIAFAPF